MSSGNDAKKFLLLPSISPRNGSFQSFKDEDEEVDMEEKKGKKIISPKNNKAATAFYPSPPPSFNPFDDDVDVNASSFISVHSGNINPFDLDFDQKNEVEKVNT